MHEEKMTRTTLLLIALYIYLFISVSKCALGESCCVWLEKASAVQHCIVTTLSREVSALFFFRTMVSALVFPSPLLQFNKGRKSILATVSPIAKLWKDADAKIKHMPFLISTILPCGLKNHTFTCRKPKPLMNMTSSFKHDCVHVLSANCLERVDGGVTSSKVQTAEHNFPFFVFIICLQDVHSTRRSFPRNFWLL
jgi:hypothetical protein